jgi:hypothetical protein
MAHDNDDESTMTIHHDARRQPDVKAYRTLTVRPQPPAALEPLERLIRNLRWTWHEPTRALFADIDQDVWR